MDELTYYAGTLQCVHVIIDTHHICIK